MEMSQAFLSFSEALAANEHHNLIAECSPAGPYFRPH